MSCWIVSGFRYRSSSHLEPSQGSHGLSLWIWTQSFARLKPSRIGGAPTGLEWACNLMDIVSQAQLLLAQAEVGIHDLCAAQPACDGKSPERLVLSCETCCWSTEAAGVCRPDTSSRHASSSQQDLRPRRTTQPSMAQTSSSPMWTSMTASAR